MFKVAYIPVVIRDEPAAKEDSNQSSSRARIPFISGLKARALEYLDDDVITRFSSVFTTNNNGVNNGLCIIGDFLIERLIK